MAILPPASLFDSSVPWPKKLNLKPGIDMAGGTKLVYEIKAPEGGGAPNLAEQVMESLKKRVDPDGVRNLVWRPQGANRLEIQMPLTGQSEAAQKARADFSKAQEALDQTNIRRSEVLRAVEKLSGDARRARLKELAMGSAKREALFDALASAHDRMVKALASDNARAEAETELEYDKLKSQIEDSNLGSTELQLALEGRAENRQKRIDDVKARFSDFPARVAAIDQFVNAWDGYAGVKGQLDDAGELKRLLRGSGVLEFHILVQGADLMSPEAQAMKERLKPGGKGVTPQANDEMRWYEVDRPEDAGNSNLVSYSDKQWVLAWTTADKAMVNRPGQPEWALEAAFPSNTDMGIRAVGFRFDSRGANDFSELTANNLKKSMAVMLDDKVISTATIQSVISRQGIISRENGYTDSEFKYLISTLNAGSLPARLADEPVSEQTVGPQLGQDNLRLGLYTCAFGLVVVAVFLIGYYYISGIVATIAVTMNLIMILGAMAAIDATFTLPGIAAIVLTVGCAVDANVLIFERLREEQRRGMGLKMALRNAYDRAFSAILDSNVTTGITAAILYWAGSEEVKGFGLTLLLGMASSMFTALFVTKTIFGLLIEKGLVNKLGSLPLTFPKWDRLLKPNIDWMSKKALYLSFSFLFIAGGMSCFIAKWHANEMLDIEFASGTSVQFELREPMKIEEVRADIEAIGKQYPKQLPSPAVVSVGSDGLMYEVVTPNPVGKDVRDAVVKAMGDKLKVERESLFEHVGANFAVARETSALLPITSDELKIGDHVIASAADHIGGVAVFMKNIEPMLSVEQIKARIDKQRLQPQPGGKMLPYREMDIEMVEAGPGNLAKSAVVLVSDPKYPFDKDEARWTEELAGPTWTLVNDAINNPPQLQKVTNFDAQVASAAQMRAMTALVLSTIVIMLYIWFRFGDMTFGTAATIATIHDTLFVLAAVGFAHYASTTAIGTALMIEPFRINLTLVAAVLTVMGYSMNDTVVVFDRIRENRGKNGIVTAKLINDAVNQTLSRTLLTGGTTIVTIFVMYLFGGSGIHGFTFTLLIGIIVGTYSSIGVASPILLFGPAARQAAARQKAVPAPSAG